jgi:hypothetical protein
MKAIGKIIPRDPFGRIYYATFGEVFEKIRFQSLKKNILILRGTKLQKVLLEECKQVNLSLLVYLLSLLMYNWLVLIFCVENRFYNTSRCNLF